MEAVITKQHVSFTVDLSKPTDISIPIQPRVTPSDKYTHPTATKSDAPVPAPPAPSGPSGPSGSGGSGVGVGVVYAPIPRPTIALDAFGIPGATCHPLVMGGWVGAVHAGSSVNCWQLTLCAHGNGTHTESVAHITSQPISIEDSAPAAALHPALLLSVNCERFSDCGGDTYSKHAKPTDLVISKRSVLAAIAALCDSARGQTMFQAVSSSPSAVSPVSNLFTPFDTAIVLRTNAWKQFVTSPPAATDSAPTKTADTTTSTTAAGADSKSKPTTAGGAASAASTVPAVCYSSRDPPYLTVEAARTLVDTFGLHHLCVDLPSVDRESDGGELLVHRILFRYPIPFGGAKQQQTPTAAAAPTATAVPTSGGGGVSGGGGSGRKRSAPFADAGPFTITELCHFPPSADASHLPDGPYLLNLCVAPIAMDAAPTRPVLYPVTKIVRSEH